MLFILTDDQRVGTIAALGNRQIHTPILGRLCAKGTAFTNAHIPSGSVPAMCMPRRVMPEKHQNMYDPNEIEFPENFAGVYFDYGIYDMRDENLEMAPNKTATWPAIPPTRSLLQP